MSVEMTICGNLAADPELKFTKSGKAVVEFTVMTSRSRKNQQTGEWENEDVTGWKVTAWERLAEYVAESNLCKGDPVIVVGASAWRSWENKDGTKGGRIEVTARKVGVDLGRWPVAPSRTTREKAKAIAEDDPWTTSSELAPF